MKKFISILCAVSLGGCAALNLTPTQQANLQLWIQAGKTVVQASANIFCAFEPTTSALIGIWDKSKGTTTFLAQLDQSTIVLCKKALASS